MNKDKISTKFEYDFFTHKLNQNQNKQKWQKYEPLVNK